MSLESSPRLAALFRIIEGSAAPMPIAVIAARHGKSQGHVGGYLRVLRDRGLVGTTRVGRGAMWALKHVADAERAKYESTVRRVRAQQNRRVYNAAMKIKAEQDFDRWAEERPTQVVVPAHLCKPIKPMGPVSVFCLGGASLRAAGHNVL